MGRIAVLDYGMGNLHSVRRALERVGGRVEVTADGDEALGADMLVIPGVGHFGACIRALRAANLERATLDFIATDRPVLGVCVGMQVLFDASEEADDIGMSALPGTVTRLPSTVKVPHMGWNTVTWTRAHPYVAGIPDGTWFYFVHSYAAGVAEGLTVGAAEHGRPFSAAVARGNVFATQFHPEKSGEAGLQLYENVVREVHAA